jgi:D-3-phosphoglycerate dehydrogenase
MDQQARELLEGYDIYEQVAEDDVLAVCEVLVTWPGRVKKELLSKMRGLKMLQSLSAGVDALDFASVPPGTVVCSNAGAYTESAAEHAWGLALGVAKGVHAGRKRLPPRHFRRGTLVVVGCGAIGSEVARLAKSSLGMTTVGVSRSFRTPDVIDEKHSMSDLGSVLDRADLVVNALPLTRATRSLFGWDLLVRCKPTVVFVNIGRGETMHRESVSKWLVERPESRYATDVFWKQDGKEVFDSPLWEMPNFGGTMHTASSQDAKALSYAKLMAAKNVRLFLETGKAENTVNISEYLG